MRLFEAKIGNGFAFLLYYALVFLFAIISRAGFVEVASALLAGLGIQTGQRTWTQVSLTKAELNAKAQTGNNGEPCQ